MTDKYTRTFGDFGNYPWPGKILPGYFEHGLYADGHRGTQGMQYHALSAYGAYHIIEGASPTIDGTEWTGAAAFGMFSGLIKSLVAASGDLSAAGSYLAYNLAGTFAVTGAKPTGIILAKNHGGSVYTAIRRQDVNSKEYFPNDIFVYGDINVNGDINGVLDDISGFDGVSANSGIFQTLQGFSDITMRDSLDFDGTYHLKGAVSITGAEISGNQITGTSGTFGNVLITTVSSNVSFNSSYTLTALASGDANGEPIRYDEYQPMEADYYATSGDYVATSGGYVATSGAYVTHAAASNPHGISIQAAFNAGKTITSANSEVNAFKVGGGSTNADLSIWGDNAILHIQSDEALILSHAGGGSGKDILFYNDGVNNLFGPDGDIDLGNDAYYWRDIYYCNFVDKTCADFRDFSSDNIYNILDQIQPMIDGVLHYSKSSDKYFPHIDFLKLPDELAAIAKEDHTIRMYKDVLGVKTEYNVDFKRGDKAGIDFGSLVYMMKDLVLKSCDKINQLEIEIEILKAK